MIAEDRRRAHAGAIVTVPDGGAAVARGRSLFGGRFLVAGRIEALRTLLGSIELFGPSYLVLRVLALIGRRRILRRAERWWARRAASRLGLDVRIGGAEVIDPAEQYVVVAMHEGFADSLALLRLPLSLTFVARAELGRWRFLGGHLAAAGHVVIDPERPLRAARSLMAQSRAALEAGDSVLVFPQGSILGLEVAFQPGAFALARQLDRPLLPVVVTGGHRVWEHPFSGTLRFGERITVEVLPPVAPAEAYDRRRQIEQAMKRAAQRPGMAPARRFDPDRDGYWDAYRYDVDAAFAGVARRVAAHRAAAVAHLDP